MVRNNILIEILSVLLFAVMWGYFSTLLAAFSVLCGGICWILPSMYFFRKAKILAHPKNLKNMLRDFLINEAIKLILSAILIVICIKLFPKILVPPFLNGYIIAIFIGLFALNRKIL